MPIKVGGVLYPGFEMLDYFGPLEMFSMLGAEQVSLYTVAQEAGPVASAIAAEVGIGPKVVADYTFNDLPQMDVVLVPGGFGTIPELANQALLDFLVKQATDAKVVASVCTGSALLAKSGLLDGKRATSNKQFFALATQQSAAVQWVEAARWVKDGKFYTSSGVSAGTDMAVAIIEELLGPEVRDTVLKGAEYTWHADAESDPFASELNVAARALGMVSES
ncbi:MAG: DJ-1/PfpI family protein [Pseudomonadota bacterium]